MRRPTTSRTASGEAGRPPDRLVLELRRRPLVLHGRRPHDRVVRRPGLPRAPARRHPLGDGPRRRRLRPEPRALAERRGLREGHARRRHPEPVRARHRARRARLLHRAQRAGQGLEAHHGDHCRDRHRPRHHEPGERAARPPAGARLHDDGPHLPELLGAAGQLEPEPALALHGRRRRDPGRLRGDHLHLAAPARGVLPHRRLARLRARRQPLHLDGRQQQPVRVERLRADRRAARARGLGRPADRGELEQPERQDPAGSCRCANPGGTPGIGTTYTIPAGNMFDEAQDTANQTLPEIYAMGFRNPFRITVDPKTGWLLLGDYGPDAGSTVANRGPQGSVEFNVVDQPGFYGWPYCVRDNVPYNDFNFATGVSGPEVQLRRPGQQLAQQHRPHEPAARAARHDLARLHRARRALPLPRHRRRADGRPALRLRPGQPEHHQVPRVLRRQVVHRRVERGLDQDGHAERRRQRARCRRLRPRDGLPAPDGHRVRAGRVALRDRVGLRLRREQPGLGHLPDRLRR